MSRGRIAFFHNFFTKQISLFPYSFWKDFQVTNMLVLAEISLLKVSTNFRIFVWRFDQKQLLAFLLSAPQAVTRSCT